MNDPEEREPDHGQQRIRAVVRVRPFNEVESMRGERALYISPDSKSVQLVTSDGNSRPLNFDHVYEEYSTQEQVFMECGATDIVHKALQGYAATIFAFGQTGSGKTFTMTGPENEDIVSSHLVNISESAGIVPRALRYLFDQIQQHPDRKYTIKAAYLEIYNEQVKDLLNPNNSTLAVRWTAPRGFFVENLFVVECEVLGDCLAVLEEGLRNRKTGSHSLNDYSSRSHSIMTIYIESDPLYDGGAPSTSGKLIFVDLAGSEKVKESKATGETLVETMNINKSLLTLGKCISGLSDTKRKSHIPYRDSKLTKLLADSLGGHGMALMIACVSPSFHCAHETYKTIRYAQRARRIKNKPVIKLTDPREELIAQLRRDLRAAKKEGAVLRAALGDEKVIQTLLQTHGVSPLRMLNSSGGPSPTLPPIRQKSSSLPNLHHTLPKKYNYPIPPQGSPFPHYTHPVPPSAEQPHARSPRHSRLPIASPNQTSSSDNQLYNPFPRPGSHHASTTSIPREGTPATSYYSESVRSNTPLHYQQDRTHSSQTLSTKSRQGSYNNSIKHPLSPNYMIASKKNNKQRPHLNRSGAVPVIPQPHRMARPPVLPHIQPTTDTHEPIHYQDESLNSHTQLNLSSMEDISKIRSSVLKDVEVLEKEIDLLA